MLRGRLKPAAVVGHENPEIAPGESRGTLTEVRGLVEKPSLAEAPSNKIISGRYILQPEVMRTLENKTTAACHAIELVPTDR